MSSVVGPGDYTQNFTATGNWNANLDHGYAAHALYAADGNGASATWTFFGTVNACYTAQVYVPDAQATNTSALYTYTTTVGTWSGTVNQNITSGWTTPSGNAKIRIGSSGTIVTTLNATGNSGGITGADAILFTQVTC